MGLSSENQSALEQELLELLEEEALYRKFNRIAFADPYPKQREFFAAVARERLLMAPNQVGKTEAGAMEMAWHLTGDYPEWWTGKKFSRPVVAMVAGEGARQVRDAAQSKLCGKPGVEEEFGSGWIPRDAFKGKPKMGHGVADAIDSITVIHKTNGVEDGFSTLSFLSYDQGRAKFQAISADIVWLDEEPPDEVFSECLARITPHTLDESQWGILYMTFTPFKNAGEIIDQYIRSQGEHKVIIYMAIEDAKHISPKAAKMMFDSYPAHEREARYYGRPGQGEGAVFTTPQSVIREDHIHEIPWYWHKLWGIDFGIGHPFAAVLIAWDKDPADCIHVVHEIKMADSSVIMHAAAIKAVGGNIPVAWPHDGNARESDGKELYQKYKEQGLLMLPEHATFETGGYSLEAGIIEMNNRFATGRLRVSATLREFWSEFVGYHREKGLIVKKKDDVMSATRIAIMMRRKAIGVAIGKAGVKKFTQKNLNSPEAIAARNDFNLFTGT